MTAWLTFDFLRVLLVLLAVYLAAPAWLALAKRKSLPVDVFWESISTAFVRVVLFLEISCLALGFWRLCLPGAVLLAYGIWLLATLLALAEQGWLWSAAPWRKAFHNLLIAVEQRELPVLALRLPDLKPRAHPVWTIAAAGLGLLLLVERAWFSLGNYRFQTIEAYTRSLNLHSLTSGQPWLPDGSVAFLAPLKFFSGLDAASVIRHSGPLLAVMLVLATGYCAFNWGRRTAAFYVGTGLAAAYAAVGMPSQAEFGAAGIAALFWMLAAALAMRSRFDAAAAAMIALLVYRQWDWTPLIHLGLAALAVICARLSEGRLGFLRFPATAGGAAALALLMASSLGTRAPDGPYQYEAAARAADSIARGFRRNTWAIVSPLHEVSLTAGRGWHVEIAEFVEKFRPEDVAARDFVFPYPVEDVFVFVEKLSLRPGGASLAGAGRYPLSGDWEPAVLAYNNPLSRASLQYRAARLMAAFLSTHTSASVYYEDPQLVIYRITQPPPKAPPRS